MSKFKAVKAFRPHKIAGEFRKFITRGNILDMAVGVIIGGAFGKIVSSLVADIIMPPINYLLKDSKLADFKFVLRAADEASHITEIAVKFGNFLQTMLDFLLIALVIFFLVRIVTHTRTEIKRFKFSSKRAKLKFAEEAAKKERADEETAKIAEAAAISESKDQTALLLEQIRDLIAQNIYHKESHGND